MGRHPRAAFRALPRDAGVGRLRHRADPLQRGQRACRSARPYRREPRGAGRPAGASARFHHRPAAGRATGAVAPFRRGLAADPRRRPGNPHAAAGRRRRRQLGGAPPGRLRHPRVGLPAPRHRHQRALREATPGHRLAAFHRRRPAGLPAAEPGRRPPLVLDRLVDHARAGRAPDGAGRRRLLRGAWPGFRGTPGGGRKG
ncbi:hypothetical protein D9M71_419300 [compost metagenome]